MYNQKFDADSLSDNIEDHLLAISVYSRQESWAQFIFSIERVISQVPIPLYPTHAEKQLIKQLLAHCVKASGLLIQSNKFNKSIDILNFCQEQIAKLDDEDPNQLFKIRMALQNNLAVCCMNASEDYAVIQKLFYQYLKPEKNPDPFLRCVLYNNITALYFQQNNVEKAFKYAIKAIELIKQEVAQVMDIIKVDILKEDQKFKKQLQIFLIASLNIMSCLEKLNSKNISTQNYKLLLSLDQGYANDLVKECKNGVSIFEFFLGKKDKKIQSLAIRIENFIKNQKKNPSPFAVEEYSNMKNSYPQPKQKQSSHLHKLLSPSDQNSTQNDSKNGNSNPNRKKRVIKVVERSGSNYSLSKFSSPPSTSYLPSPPINTPKYGQPREPIRPFTVHSAKQDDPIALVSSMKKHGKKKPANHNNKGHHRSPSFDPSSFDPNGIQPFKLKTPKHVVIRANSSLVAQGENQQYNNQNNYQRAALQDIDSKFQEFEPQPIMLDYQRSKKELKASKKGLRMNSNYSLPAGYGEQQHQPYHPLSNSQHPQIVVDNLEEDSIKVPPKIKNYNPRNAYSSHHLEVDSNQYSGFPSRKNSHEQLTDKGGADDQATNNTHYAPNNDNALIENSGNGLNATENLSQNAEALNQITQAQGTLQTNNNNNLGYLQLSLQLLEKHQKGFESQLLTKIESGFKELAGSNKMKKKSARSKVKDEEKFKNDYRLTALEKELKLLKEQNKELLYNREFRESELEKIRQSMTKFNNNNNSDGFSVGSLAFLAEEHENRKMEPTKRSQYSAYKPVHHNVQTPPQSKRDDDDSILKNQQSSYRIQQIKNNNEVQENQNHLSPHLGRGSNGTPTGIPTNNDYQRQNSDGQQKALKPNYKIEDSAGKLSPNVEQYQIQLTKDNQQQQHSEDATNNHTTKDATDNNMKEDNSMVFPNSSTKSMKLNELERGDSLALNVPAGFEALETSVTHVNNVTAHELERKVVIKQRVLLDDISDMDHSKPYHIVCRGKLRKNEKVFKIQLTTPCVTNDQQFLILAEDELKIPEIQWLINRVDYKDVIPTHVDTKHLRSSYSIMRFILLPFISFDKNAENNQLEIKVTGKARGMIDLQETTFLGQTCIATFNHIENNVFRLNLTNANVETEAFRLDIEVDNDTFESTFQRLEVVSNSEQNNNIEMALKLIEGVDDDAEEEEMQNAADIVNNLSNQNSVDEVQIETYQPKNMTDFMQKLNLILEQISTYFKEQDIQTFTQLFTENEQLKFFKLKAEKVWKKMTFFGLRENTQKKVIEVKLKNFHQSFGAGKEKVYARGHYDYDCNNLWKHFGLYYQKVDISDKMMVLDLLSNLFYVDTIEKPLAPDEYDQYDENSIRFISPDIACFKRQLKGEKYKFPMTMSLLGVKNRPIGVKVTIYNPNELCDSGIFLHLNYKTWEKDKTIYKKKKEGKYTHLPMIDDYHLDFILKKCGWDIIQNALLIDTNPRKMEVVGVRMVKGLSMTDHLENVVNPESIVKIFKDQDKF